MITHHRRHAPLRRPGRVSGPGRISGDSEKIRRPASLQQHHEAEEKHLAWLKDAFAALGLSFPVDASGAYIQVPVTLLDAYKAGVQAEIDNIAMYDRFLDTALIQNPENKDLKILFTNLRNASENHLRAFQNQLTKY
jgi:hypothetical protein